LRLIAIIPSRYASTRFPAKPLALIHGRPMLDWVIKGVLQAKSISKVLVATDDDRIVKVAETSGAEAVMTESDLPTGTDRVFAAYNSWLQQRYGRSSGAVARPGDSSHGAQTKNGLSENDIIINVQGDEPLIEGSVLESLCACFSDPSVSMATLGSELDLEALNSPQTAKIVLDSNDNAIYFSRAPIPFTRVPISEASSSDRKIVLKHIGIYAFRAPCLKAFCEHPQTSLERLEGLEQLRAIAMGLKVRVVRTQHESWGVDIPSDILKIESLLDQRKKRI
jgi:3-deoxy-manno-octulosonate cytidylyltransferase (CMP-KDO synthetase)